LKFKSVRRANSRRKRAPEKCAGQQCQRKRCCALQPMRALQLVQQQRNPRCQRQCGPARRQAHAAQRHYIRQSGVERTQQQWQLRQRSSRGIGCA